MNYTGAFVCGSYLGVNLQPSGLSERDENAMRMQCNEENSVNSTTKYESRISPSV